MNFSKRLKALEDRLVTDPVTLHFADGSTAVLPSRVGRRDHVMDLVAGAVRSERSRELDLIATAVTIDEPGGGHLCELARAIWLSPIEQSQ